MDVIGTPYLIIAIIIAVIASYKVGYHQGAVDKHKEIFDLLRKEVKELEDCYSRI